MRLPDSLMVEVKTLAAETGRTMTAVIEDALREHLARIRAPRTGGSFKLMTFGRGGLLPGVDIDRTADLIDQMEEGLPIDKRR